MDLRLAKFVLRFPLLFAFVIISYEISAIFLVFQLKVIAKFFEFAIFQQVALSNLQKILILIVVIVLSDSYLYFWGSRVEKNRYWSKSLLRKLLMEKIVFESNLMGRSSAELQSIFVDDIEAIDAYFSQFLPQVFLSFFVPVTFLFFVFPIDSLSATIFLVTAPLIPFFMYLIGKYSNKKNAKQLDVLHKMSAFFLDSIQGIKTIILLNQTSSHQKRIEKASDDYRKSTIAVLKVSFLSAFSLELLSTISTAIIAVQIGIRLLYGQLSFEYAFLILLIAPEFYLPLRNLGVRFHAAMNGIEAAKHVFQIIYAIPEKKTTENSHIKLSQIKSKDPIIFQNVSFSYQSGEELLNEIKFEIKSGTRTAIVGQNGVGKSTIFQLLMRFIEPKQGQILFQNQRISDFTLESWRGQIAWLPQNPVMLNDTIRNNLKISKSNANDLELIAVLEKVHLWDLVKQFENGLDTNLNDLGKRLSSGEMQRLSFGRVLLRNRPIILLDEPTSFLDKESEKIIIELVETLSRSATVISIAHRLNTVLNSDQIIFICNKKVAAIGRHEDLLESNLSYSLFSRAYFGTIQ